MKILQILSVVIPLFTFIGALPSTGKYYNTTSSSFLDIIPKDANIVHQEWNLTETSVHPDGRYRRGFLINGQSPGPLIEGNQGDWVVLKVNNYLSVSNTIHFHGIRQNGTIFSDGVPGVTQYPILSGDSYTYVWKMEDYGFFWYHSHFRGYANDGLVGPIYIHPSDDIEKPFKEITSNETEIQQLEELESKPNFLIISDWFKDSFDDLFVKMNAYGLDPTCTQTMLINGKGRHYCFLNQTYIDEAYHRYQAFMKATKSDTWHIDSFGCMDRRYLDGYDSITYDKDLLEFAGHNKECFNTTIDQEVYYTEGKDYVVMNVLNTGGVLTKTMTIDDHRMTVIAVDGNYVHPQTVEQLYIPIGMRFTIVIQTKADEHDNIEDPFAIRLNSDELIQVIPALAYLQYGSYSNLTYQNIQNNFTIDSVNGVKHNNMEGDLLHDDWEKLNPYSLVPYDDSLKPPTGAADVTIYSYLQQIGKAEFSVYDGQLFKGGKEMDLPILFKLQQNSTLNATGAFGGAVIDLGIKEGDVVDVIFQNDKTAAHPMHLHGHTFWVIARNTSISTFGYNSTEEALDDGRNDLFNFETPSYVDNILVEKGGYSVIRFIASNSISMLHCHIQAHLAFGMAAVVVEDKSKLDALPKSLSHQSHVDFDLSKQLAPLENNSTIT